MKKKKLISLEEHERNIRERDKVFLETGVFCPKCFDELLYSDDMIIMTMPSQRNVYCPCCQYRTKIRI